MSSLIMIIVTTALVTAGDATVVVAARLLGQGLQKRLLGLVGRDLCEVRDRLMTATRRSRLVLFDSH